MNDGHKGMTCEREKVGEGEKAGIFCVILSLAVSSEAPSMKIALLSGASVTDVSYEYIFSVFFLFFF